MTDTEAALPLPLADAGAMRRLGAEVIEYPVGAEHAIVGSRVRELGLPRDALLNLLIRGDQALLPRGSTRIEAGDRLHLIVRQEVAVELRELMGRWREGPIGARPRPVRKHLTRQTPFVLRPWGAHPGDDGDPSHPTAVHGVDVIDQIRTRRDGRPGAVVLLEDGRYAFTGQRRRARQRVPGAEGRAAAAAAGEDGLRARLVARGDRRAARRARSC